MKYSVEIKEVLRRKIIVEAENESEAEAKASDIYEKCEVVLDENDFCGEPDIKCLGVYYEKQ